MVKRFLTAIVLLAAVCLAASCNAQKAAQAPKPDIQIHQVLMRDGVELSTAVALPDGEGPWPVILTRTPYGKMAPMQSAAGINRGGFARVVQDLRGRFDSKGVDSVFLTDGWGELQDGYDTIEWIGKQPWCDGNVAMLGGSATGITQYLAAGAGSSYLKACHATVACASLYDHACFQGGAFRKALVENWMKGQKFSDAAFDLIVSNPVYNDLWAAVDLTARAPKVTTPMVHVGGWYDVFAQGTLNAFMALQHDGGKGAKGNQVLVFGPWTHGCKPEGELRFPASAMQNPGGRIQAVWFGRWLSGKPSAVLDEPPVSYYVMGACDEPGAPGNEWRNVADWPVPATATPLYLHQSGLASFEPPAEEQASLGFDYDPSDPVPTVGGCNLTIARGPRDQREVEERDDVLVFTSEPLAEPLEVTGQVFAQLHVSSDCPDTDFTAKLTDVYPDGRSMLVCDGILRMRFRDGTREEKLMEPGNAYEAKIDMWSTSLIFNKGHRIRVAISSSNAPRFDPNPNTGRGFRADEETAVAHNMVYLCGDMPSRIVLPVPDS